MNEELTTIWLLVTFIDFFIVYHFYKMLAGVLKLKQEVKELQNILGIEPAPRMDDEFQGLVWLVVMVKSWFKKK